MWGTDHKIAGPELTMIENKMAATNDAFAETNPTHKELVDYTRDLEDHMEHAHSKRICPPSSTPSACWKWRTTRS